jgi:uncharacterized membrane protein YiaA
LVVAISLAAKLRVFHDGTSHRFAECHQADETDYFFAVLAGSAFAALLHRKNREPRLRFSAS